jgi:hypothetical protein
VSVDWDEVLPDPVPAPAGVVTRRRVLVAALLTAVALLVGTATWLLTSDPLELDSLTGAPGGTLAWTEVDAGFADRLYYVSAGEAGRFEIGYDVANTGRLPLTIQGIASGTAFTLAGMARYPTFEEPDRMVAGEIVPFEPVTVDPGDSRYLVLQLRIAGELVCTSRGAMRVPSDPGLSYRIGGFVPRTVTLDLPFTVVEVCGDELPPTYSWLDRAR